MKVLLIVPTYGRIQFLNRTLASFLSQNYDDKELVIINDDKNVQLACDYKNVICINMNKKILVGQKRNMAVNTGFYDLYMPHDDDDLFLPDRISNHVKIYNENKDLEMYHDQTSYMVYGNKFLVSASGPSCLSFTRKGWFNVKGYAHTENKAEDQEFFSKFKKGLAQTKNNDYVYNFGGINYHLSCHSDKSIEEIAYKELSDLNLLNKKYHIEPDYEEYKKFVELERLYKETKTPVIVKHVKLGKIQI